MDVSVHVIMLQVHSIAHEITSLHVHISVHVQPTVQVFMFQVNSMDHELISLHVLVFESLGELIVTVNVAQEFESEIFSFQDKYLSAFSKVILSSPDVR